MAEHLRPLGIPYDPDVVAVVREAAEALGGVRANAAFRLLRGRRRPRHRHRRGCPLGPHFSAEGGEVGRIPPASDLEGVHLVLRRGTAALPAVRRR